MEYESLPVLVSKSMKRYIKIYSTLLRLNFISLVTYRGNLINSMIASLVWGFFSLYSIVLLTSKTQAVFGWKREELLLLNGLYGIIVGTFHMFFSFNMQRFSRIVHYGDLDMILTKPVDSQFLVSLWQISYATIFRILLAVGYSWYLMKMLHLVLHWSQIIGFILFAFVGLMTLYSVWFTVITLTIWFTNLSNLTDFMFTLTGLARYPQELSSQFVSYIFFIVLPLTVIVTTPAKILLSKLQVSDGFFVVLLSMFIFVISRRFWKFALRYYGSASS